MPQERSLSRGTAFLQDCRCAQWRQLSLRIGAGWADSSLGAHANSYEMLGPVSFDFHGYQSLRKVRYATRKKSAPQTKGEADYFLYGLLLGKSDLPWRCIQSPLLTQMLQKKSCNDKTEIKVCPCLSPHPVSPQKWHLFITNINIYFSPYKFVIVFIYFIHKYVFFSV